MVTKVQRPMGLHGCWETWSEQDMPVTIRSEMENGKPKVRRRFTGVVRRAQASVRYPREHYDEFMEWYRILCSSGVNATNIMEPAGVEGYWRFTEPPQITWLPGATVFEASVALEQLPGW